MQIQPYTSPQQEAVIQLALRAWAPVFTSLESTMDPAVFREFYPDWRTSQREAVRIACTSKEMEVWVALEEGLPLGFVALKFHQDDRMGEIHMIAVDPEHQRRGTGSALTAFALRRMQEAGMSIAMVETGGDPGHAPARQTYQKLGFGLLPIARYFKKL